MFEWIKIPRGMLNINPICDATIPSDIDTAKYLVVLKCKV